MSLFSLSVMFDSLCPMDCNMPALHHLLEMLKLMSIESVMPSNHLVLCRPLCSYLQSSLASGSFLHIRWPKYWSFSFSISSSNEYSGLIFFRIDWFDLLAVQGTLKSLLPHRSSKASTLGHSNLFIMYSVINQQSQTKGEKKPPLLLRPLWLPTYLPSFIANLSISTVSATYENSNQVFNFTIPPETIPLWANVGFHLVKLGHSFSVLILLCLSIVSNTTDHALFIEPF